jgi:ribose transport system substrate-binding protein
MWPRRRTALPPGIAPPPPALRLCRPERGDALLRRRGPERHRRRRASGVELLILDNRYDPDVAIQNAEEFVAKRVDLVLEFQVEERVAPRVAHIFKKAEIPLVAIDVPHPNATYFGVDNFEVGYEAGSLLAQHALRKWKGKVDWVLGVGFSEAGSFVQSRITGAFDGIRDRLIPICPRPLHSARWPRHAPAQPTRHLRFLRGRRKGERFILVAAATDSSALGVLDAVRQPAASRTSPSSARTAFPKFEEMRSGKSAIIGSISHEVETYGPRLIQLGIALLRGYTVPPYNYA